MNIVLHIIATAANSSLFFKGKECQKRSAPHKNVVSVRNEDKACVDREESNRKVNKPEVVVDSGEQSRKCSVVEIESILQIDF